MPRRTICQSLRMSSFLVQRGSAHLSPNSEKVILNLSTVQMSLSSTDHEDVTIAYYPPAWHPPTLFQIFCLKRISPEYKFHVHVRRYSIEDVYALCNSFND